MNRLSIIITYYNKGKALLTAIDSVLNQKFDCEIIVVDDCSDNKESQESLQYVKQKYPNIDFFSTPHNLGAAGAKNFGIEKSSGDIVVLLDADDALPQGTLLHIDNFFSRYPDTDLLFGNYVLNKDDLLQQETIDCSDIAIDGLLDPQNLIKRWKLLGSSPFRKKAWKETGGFDVLFPKTEDVDFHIRMILSEKKIRYINKTIYQWNCGPEGNFMTKNRVDSAYSVCRNIKFFYLYSNKILFLLKLMKNIWILSFTKLKST